MWTLVEKSLNLMLHDSVSSFIACREHTSVGQLSQHLQYAVNLQELT